MDHDVVSVPETRVSLAVPHAPRAALSSFISRLHPTDRPSIYPSIYCRCPCPVSNMNGGMTTSSGG